jgi:MOSC domain-containing protein YiiM
LQGQVPSWAAPVPDVPATVFPLVAVAVGQPTVIGENRQGDVVSGIRKHHVTTPTVHVGRTNIVGDAQADLRNHGGVDKAVYCYPRETRAYWRNELVYDREEAPFGENLSILGADEETVCIGDIWRWGTALLQVSQPRWPCYKLALHIGCDDMVKRFVDAARTGWYLRVLEEGDAPTSGVIVVEERDPLGITVRQAFLARRGDAGPDLIERVMAHPALAAVWKR